MLLLIKIIHTLVWVIVATAIFYILYCGLTNKSNKKLIAAIILSVVEGIILLTFGWVCPLTIIAKRYVETPTLGFDIFLPKWFIPYNKTFFTIVFTIGILLVLFNYIRKKKRLSYGNILLAISTLIK